MFDQYDPRRRLALAQQAGVLPQQRARFQLPGPQFFPPLPQPMPLPRERVRPRISFAPQMGDRQMGFGKLRSFLGGRS